MRSSIQRLVSTTTRQIVYKSALPRVLPQTAQSYRNHVNLSRTKHFYSTTLAAKYEYDTPSTLSGPPVKALAYPGECQLGTEPVLLTLENKWYVSPSSAVFRFALPDTSQPLNLSTCACLLARAQIPGTLKQVTRPYTPISTNADVGYFDLLIKNYREHGTLSTFLHEQVSVADEIHFFHIPQNVKIQADELMQTKHLLLLAGGTGITPILQALHALLGQENAPRITLLYGSQMARDILAQSLLDEWAAQYPDQFQLVHVISRGNLGSSHDAVHWEQGFIDATLIQKYFLEHDKKNADTLVLVCGPPPFYQALCGPREEEDTIQGALADLGYSAEQVYKF